MALPQEHPRSACVFCGATDRKISKEHVWPQWLRKFIQYGEGPPIQHSRIRSRKGRTTARTDWVAIPIDWKVKGPCKPCNEVWMEDLERECRPILIPMLRNEEVVLDAAACHSLAQWVTLKVLMAQHGHEAGMQVIPPSTYHSFYRSRSLPAGAQVWTGRYGGAGAWPCDYQHLALYYSQPPTPEPDTPNAYVVTLTVGYVAFAYFGHEIKEGPVLTLTHGLNRYLVPIWPSADAVNWPPIGVFDARGLELALRSLEI